MAGSATLSLWCLWFPLAEASQNQARHYFSASLNHSVVEKDIAAEVICCQVRWVRHEEQAMRRWYVPLTVLGLGSISVMLLSERARRAISALFRDFGRVTGRLLEWNDGPQDELDRIQAMLDKVAESLDVDPKVKTSG